MEEKRYYIYFRYISPSFSGVKMVYSADRGRVEEYKAREERDAAATLGTDNGYWIVESEGCCIPELFKAGKEDKNGPDFWEWNNNHFFSLD